MREKGWMSFIIFSYWIFSDLGGISNSWKRFKRGWISKINLQGQRERLVKFTGFQ